MKNEEWLRELLGCGCLWERGRLARGLSRKHKFPLCDFLITLYAGRRRDACAPSGIRPPKKPQIIKEDTNQMVSYKVTLLTSDTKDLGIFLHFQEKDLGIFRQF